MSRTLTRKSSFLSNTNDLSSDDLNALLTEVVNGLRSRRDLENILGISKSQANKKIKKFKDQKAIYLNRGRPPSLDETSTTNLVETLQKMRQTQKTASSQEMKQLFSDEREATLSRQHKSTISTKISKSTVKRYCQGLDIRAVKPQSTTAARQRAIFDPRNFITSSIMHQSLVEGLIPQMVFNFDATSFQISTNDDLVHFVYDEDDSSPVTRVSDGGLDIFVKVLVCHNAGGDLGPIVYIIADKNSDETTYYDIFPSSDEPRDRIIFAQSRGGNEEIYKFYLNETVIPFIKKTKANYIDIGVNSSCVFLDGEYQQVRAIMNEDTMYLLLNEAIRVGKSAASCSNTMQASDVSPLFRSSKSRLHSLEEVFWQDTALESRISAILEHKGFTTMKKNKLTTGLLKISAAIKNSATPSIIKQGYRDSGIYPIDFHQTLSKCKATISEKDQSIIESHFDDMLDLFDAQGQLTEADMNRFDMPIALDEERTKLPKDQRDITHRRAIELTHQEIRNEYYGIVSSSDSDSQVDDNDASIGAYDEGNSFISPEVSSKGRLIKRKRFED